MADFRREFLPDPETYHGGTDGPIGPGARGTAIVPVSRRERLDAHKPCVGRLRRAWPAARKAGDVLSFHMKSHGLDFISAARELGALVDDGVHTKGPANPRRLPANEALQLLYHDTRLNLEPGGQRGRRTDSSDRQGQRRHP